MVLLSSFRLGAPRGLPVALLASACLMHPLVQAQHAPGRLARPDPSDPQARVPAIHHASPLAGHRRLGDDLRLDWTQANQTVNRIGGWRAYAREAHTPEVAASAAASPANPAPAPAAAPRAASGPGPALP